MIIQRTDGAVYAEDDSDHVVTTVVYEDSADCSGVKCYNKVVTEVANKI